MAELAVIDTSVFVIDLRYKRDKNFAANREFLERVADERTGLTTIFNLLELCGILSFNLNERQIRELYFYFPQRYRVDVLPHPSLDDLHPAFGIGDLLNIMVRRASFGDALIIAAIERHVINAGRFVSWNAKHFRSRLSIPSVTPREFLKERR